jgi:hypothetical protein
LLFYTTIISHSFFSISPLGFSFPLRLFYIISISHSHPTILHHRYFLFQYFTPLRFIILTSLILYHQYCTCFPIKQFYTTSIFILTAVFYTTGISYSYFTILYLQDFPFHYFTQTPPPPCRDCPFFSPRFYATSIFLVLIPPFYVTSISYFHSSNLCTPPVFSVLSPVFYTTNIVHSYSTILLHLCLFS